MAEAKAKIATCLPLRYITFAHIVTPKGENRTSKKFMENSFSSLALASALALDLTHGLYSHRRSASRTGCRP